MEARGRRNVWLAVVAVIAGLLVLFCLGRCFGNVSAAEKIVVGLDRYGGPVAEGSPGLALVDLDAGIMWLDWLPEMVPLGWGSDEWAISVDRAAEVIHLAADGPSGSWRDLRFSLWDGAFLGESAFPGDAPAYLGATRGRWLIGTGEGYVCKIITCEPSARLVAWDPKRGRFSATEPLFGSLIKFWRWSDLLQGFLGPCWFLEDSGGVPNPDALGWLRVAYPASREIASYGWPEGARLVMTFVAEEVPTGSSPTGVAWVFGGTYGWVAAIARADIPPQDWRLLPDAGSTDWTKDFKCRSDGLFRLASRHVERIEPAGLVVDWRGADVPGWWVGNWAEIVFAGDRIVISYLGQDYPYGALPGLVSYDRTYGFQYGAVELPHEARFIASIDGLQ